MKKLFILLFLALSFIGGSSTEVVAQNQKIGLIVPTRAGYDQNYLTWLGVIQNNGDAIPVYRSNEDIALNQLFVDLQTYSATNFYTSKLDALWAAILNNTSLANLSKYNLLDATKYKLIPSGTVPPTYGKFGWTGTSTGYLRTQYNPATNGVNWTQNSASMFVFQMEGNSGIYTLMGASNAGLSSRNIIDTRLDAPNANQYAFCINSGSATVGGTVKDAQGLWMTNRTASNVQRYVLDGTLVVSNSTASVALLSQEIYIGADNRNGTPTINSPYTFSFAGVGGGMTSQQEADLSAIFYRFFKTITTQSASTVVPPRPYGRSWANLVAAMKKVTQGSNGINSIVTSTQVNNIANYFTAGDNVYEGACIKGGRYLYVSPTAANHFMYYDTWSPTGAPVTFGPALAGTGIQWSGMCFWAQRYMIYCPYDATSIAVVDTNDNSGYFVDGTGIIGSWTSGSSTLTGTYSGNLGASGGKWNSNVVAAYDTMVYMSAWSGDTRMLKFNPANNAISYIATPGWVNTNTLGMTNGPDDNKLYLAPFNATVMYVFNCVTQTFDNTTFTGFSASTSKFSGIILTAKNILFFVPYSYNKVAGVDLNNNTKITEFGSFTSGSGFYGSGTWGFDDNITCLPEFSNTLGLFIDTTNRTAVNFTCPAGSYVSCKMNAFGQIFGAPTSTLGWRSVGYKFNWQLDTGWTDNIWFNKAY